MSAVRLLLLLLLALHLGVAPLWAAFPAPTPTPLWADLLGAFSIAGEPAQVGDSIAFFDPSGVVCGRYTVPTGGEGHYGIVHLYADDPTTTSDEGCSEGDLVEVRVVRALDGQAFAHAELSLTPATLAGFSAAALPLTWHAGAANALGVDAGAPHFAAPTPTPYSAALIGQLQIALLPAQRGDELRFSDADGHVVGRFRVVTAGQYGVVPLYGDDPLTAQDEGAVAGEPLSLAVWDASSGAEYPHAWVRQGAGAPLGSFIGATTPLAWQEGVAQVLDLSALSLDVDANGVVQAQDALLVQRYQFGLRGAALLDGLELSGARREAAAIEAFLASLSQVTDVDGDGVQHPLGDGLMLRRYLAGGFDAQTIGLQAISPGGVRNGTGVIDYLQAITQ